MFEISVLFLLLLGFYFFFENKQFKKKAKGFVGEWFVYYHIKKNIDLTESVILNNVLLPAGKGTTQIDHIIVAPSGIWVVETKFLGGWITGKYNSSQWKQSFFYFKKEFQNPFRQNLKHCKTIQGLTGLSDDNIHNVVILLSDFKDKPIKNLFTRISSFTVQFNQNKKNVIDDVDSIVEVIWNAKLENTLKNKNNHIKHVKEIIEEKKSLICKHCKNTEGLVIKKGYSEYIHCPKCDKNSKKQ